MNGQPPRESIASAQIRRPGRAVARLVADPGWPFVLAGVVMLCAWALIPAAADRDGLREQLRDLERRRELAAARTAEHRRTIEHLARAVTAPPDEAGRVDPGDQETLRRLSMALLRRMPAGQSEMVVDGQPPPPLVERLVPWDEPASEFADGGPARSAEESDLEGRPSRLEQLVSGPGRLWVAGLAVFSVFTGLLLGPSATGAGAAGGGVRRGRMGRAGRHRPCRPTGTVPGLPAPVGGRNHSGLSIESRSAPETAGRIGHTLAPPPPGVVEDPPQSGPADSAARTGSDVIVRVNAMEQAMNGAVLEMPTNMVTDEVLDAASDGPGVLLDEAMPSVLEPAPAGPVALEDDEEDEDFDYFDDEDEDEDEDDDGFWYEDDEEESDDDEEDEEDGDDDDDEEDDDDDEDAEDEDDEEDGDEYEYSDDDEDEEYEYEDDDDEDADDEDEED